MICKSFISSSGSFYYNIWWNNHLTEDKAEGCIGLVFGGSLILIYSWPITFFFAAAVDITSRFPDLIDSKISDLHWAGLFSILADGPNLNKAMWRNLNADFETNNYRGLNRMYSLYVLYGMCLICFIWYIIICFIWHIVLLVKLLHHLDYLEK